jgi:hypothetical protein
MTFPVAPGVRDHLVNDPAIEENHVMLETIAVILVVLWLLGLTTSYTLGGLIHILLVLAIVAVLVRIIQGRRPV